MVKRLLLLLATTGLCCTVSAETYTVAKDGSADFVTIQNAINSCVSSSDTVKVLDSEVYEERVEIIKKQGIILTSSGYTGATNQIDYSGFPTIQWEDLENVHPETYAELSTMPDNYLTNGAISVQESRDIEISGFIVDGNQEDHGTHIYNQGIYGGKYALEHGITNISLYQSKSVIIRGCDIRNSFFGIYISGKVRGAAYSAALQDDADFLTTIPMSQVGATGNHLIENNKIHNGSFALGVKSLWGAASTIRYNLIYNNIEGGAHSGSLQAGFIVGEDCGAQPMLVYGNSLLDNSNLVSHRYWRGGINMLFGNNVVGYSDEFTYPMSGLECIDDFATMYNNIFQPTDEVSTSTQFISSLMISSDELDPPIYVMFSTDLFGGYLTDDNLEHDSSLVDGKNMLFSYPLLDSRLTSLPSFSSNVDDRDLTGMNNRLFVTYSSEGIHRTLFNSFTDSSDSFLTLNSSDDWLQAHNDEMTSTIVKDNSIDNNPATVGALVEYDGDVHWAGKCANEQLHINGGTLVEVSSDNKAKINFSLILEQGSLQDIDLTTLKIVSMEYYSALPYLEPYDDDSKSSMPYVAPISIISNISTGDIALGANSVMVNLPALATENNIGSINMVISAENTKGESVVSNIASFPIRDFIYTYTAIDFTKNPFTSGIAISFEDKEGNSVTTVDKDSIVYLTLKSDTLFDAGNLALSSGEGVMYSTSGDTITAWVNDANEQTPFVTEGRLPVIFKDAAYYHVTASGVTSNSSVVYGVSSAISVQGEQELSTEPMVDFAKKGYAITIAPNPVVEQMDIIVASKVTDVVIEIYNAAGSKIKVISHAVFNGETVKIDKHEIDEISRGEYYALLTVSGEKKAGMWFHIIE